MREGFELIEGERRAQSFSEELMQCDCFLGMKLSEYVTDTCSHSRSHELSSHRVRHVASHPLPSVILTEI